jgi:hypothetical protein
MHVELNVARNPRAMLARVAFPRRITLKENGINNVINITKSFSPKIFV